MNNKEYISNSLQTIFEMLKDRNIDLKGVDQAGLPQLMETNPGKSTIDIILDKIKITYYLPAKFKWPEIKKSLEEDEATYDLILLIVKEPLSQNNVKLLNALGLPMQVFHIKELQFNITKHVLVPRHELISDESEVKNIINRYSLKTKFQLPHILKTDPMSRYLGLKSGDIVKITRPSQTAAEYVTYRCCL
jgi:DNA-directed RNA polymerase subunit H (RpoH/RPB5)